MFRVHMFLTALYCCAIPVVIPATSSSTTGLTQRHFYLQPNPRRGPVRLGRPWVVRSRKSCGVTCMSKYNNCTSFLFNSQSGLCTPGAYINEKQPLPSSAEGDFFQSFYCDASKGFSVMSYMNTTACLVYLGEKRNYTAADDDCQSRGAYLVSVKTVEKYKLYLNLIESRPAWVGCDDISQEGEFVWKDDGQTMTASQSVTLFGNGEPNNQYGKEDCLLYGPWTSGIMDIPCDENHFYVCEMPYR